MEIKFVLFLPRDAASVPVSRQVLDGCLGTLGVMADTRTDIALALTEACANVIRHAGPGDEYEVQASVGDERCIIEVVNTGGGDGVTGAAAAAAAAGAGPVPVTAEHGRGLQIIDAVVDDLRLRPGPDKGTTVHFEKTLNWTPGAAGRHLAADDA